MAARPRARRPRGGGAFGFGARHVDGRRIVFSCGTSRPRRDHRLRENAGRKIKRERSVSVSLSPSAYRSLTLLGLFLFRSGLFRGLLRRLLLSCHLYSPPSCGAMECAHIELGVLNSLIRSNEPSFYFGIVKKNFSARFDAIGVALGMDALLDAIA